MSGPSRSDTAIQVEIACAQPIGLCGGELEEWLVKVVGEIAPDVSSFGVRLMDDDEMMQLNGTYRGREETTDVLSFPGDETPEGRHLGDVAIAVGTAQRQASAAGVELLTELRVLALHGVLHCLGYDHATDDGEMLERERKLRSRFIPEFDPEREEAAFGGALP